MSGKVEGLVAKWRNKADSLQFSGTWPGDYVADFVRDCAGDLESALADAQSVAAGGEVVRTGTVADIPDDELLGRVVRIIAPRRPRAIRQPAWARISDAFGLGSTYSAQLCRRFGLDPDTGAALATQHGDNT